MRPPPQLLQVFRLLLLCSLFLTVVASAQIPHASFEVATVRPAPPDADPNNGSWSRPGVGRFQANHVTLALLIQLAYGVDDSQITNKPTWLESNLYDVDARPEDGIQLTRDQLKPRLQDLLHERFGLEIHAVTNFNRGYALVAGKGGPHLTLTKGDHFPGFRENVSAGQMRGFNWSMSQLAKYLTPAVGFPVVDETGITGSYDIGFSYNPSPDRESDLPSLSEALNQATGLQLKPQKISVETLVIDSVNKVPAVN